jgi:hypothetical protein
VAGHVGAGHVGAGHVGAGLAGFSEAAVPIPDPAGLDDVEARLIAVEERALSYPVQDIEDLRVKLDFILARVEELTDEKDEFLRYADSLRASVLSLIRAREGRG